MKGEDIVRMVNLLQRLGLWDWYNSEDGRARGSMLRFDVEPPDDEVVYAGQTCLYTSNRGLPIVNIAEIPGLPAGVQHAMRASLEQGGIGHTLTAFGKNARQLSAEMYQRLCQTHDVPHGTPFGGRKGGPLEVMDIVVTPIAIYTREGS